MMPVIAGRARRLVLLLVLIPIAAGGWLLRQKIRATNPHQDLGERHYFLGAYKAAESEARQALADRKDDARALRLLARASARLDKDDTARRLYHRLGPETMQPEDHVLLALTLIREGRAKDAREALQFALQDQPDHAEARLQLAKIALDEAKPMESIALADPLAGQAPWEVPAGVILGFANDLASNPAGAVPPLLRALDRDPQVAGTGKTPAEVRKLLARMLLKIRRPDQARDQLRIVLDDGADAEASWLLSRAELQRGDTSAASLALELSGSYGSDHPERFEPAPYLGAARCAECHQSIHDNQQRSRHAQTFHAAKSWTGTPLPAGPVNDPHEPKSSHTLERAAGELGMTTRVRDATYKAVVDYALGSGDRGVTFVGHDEAGKTRELRLSHFGKAAGWDVTAGHPRLPPDPRDYLGLVQSQDALQACLGCHTTNPAAILGRVVGPEAKDHAIGCERCHGPGGNHLDAIASAFADSAIGRPRLASSEAIVGLCGQCHGVGNRSVPKDNPIALVRFQATTLPMSRCYSRSRGALSCVTCHEPHRDAETSPAAYESKCLACHGPPPSAAARADARESHLAPSLPDGIRRVPCPVNPAKGCIGCHMPERDSQMPHSRFTDHDIRVDREKPRE